MTEPKQLPAFVVIDSTVLISDISRRGNDMRLLLAAAARDRFQLVVPQIVIKETVRKFASKRHEAELRYLGAFKALQKLVPAKIDAEEVFATEKEAFERFRRDLLHDLNGAEAEMPGPPDVGHSEIVDRIMEGRRPSDAGKDSYRDILIWMTVVDYAAKADVAFVTSDSDFSDDDELANDLVSDLLTRGIAAENVTLYRSLRSFLDEFIVPDARLLSELIELHRTDAQFGSQVEQVVWKTILHNLAPGTPVGFLNGPYADVVGWALIGLRKEFLSLHFDDARSLGDNEALVELRCHLSVSLELMPRDEWWKAPRIIDRPGIDERQVEPPEQIDEAILLVILEGKWHREGGISDLRVTRHWGLEQFP